jgi:integrase
LLGTLDGVSRIMAMLLYGSGLRLMERLRLRVKNINFTRGEILGFLQRLLSHRFTVNASC